MSLGGSAGGQDHREVVSPDLDKRGSQEPLSSPQMLQEVRSLAWSRRTMARVMSDIRWLLYWATTSGSDLLQ